VQRVANATEDTATVTWCGGVGSFISRTFFEGYERASRGRGPPGPGPSGRRGRAEPARRTKRDEPQGRQRDATSPRAVRGGSRRGGEKPRGRNMRRRWSSDAEAHRRAIGGAREWTRTERRRRGDRGIVTEAWREPSGRWPSRRIPREAGRTSGRGGGVELRSGVKTKQVLDARTEVHVAWSARSPRGARQRWRSARRGRGIQPPAPREPRGLATSQKDGAPRRPGTSHEPREWAARERRGPPRP
jgi:hypothetical protein